MTNDQISSQPTRRKIFASIAGIGAAGVLYHPAEAAFVHPDAELVAIGQEAAPLIAEYNRLMTYFFQLSGNSPELEAVGAASDVPFDRLTELFNRALELRATTWDGVKAKAALLGHEIRVNCTKAHQFNRETADTKVVLAWDLSAEIVALGASI